jgi:hypothetical protein
VLGTLVEAAATVKFAPSLGGYMPGRGGGGLGGVVVVVVVVVPSNTFPIRSRSRRSPPRIFHNTVWMIYYNHNNHTLILP